jgi:hypothetical protein
MRNIVRTLVVLLVATLVSSVIGAIPQMNVSVSDASGKSAYKGATNAKGSFATGALKPGNYAVQFSSSTAPKGTKYTFVISAGSKKVSADAIAAEKLAGGGVAMKIDVGSGLNISGQVVAQDKGSAPVGHNGKPMVWIQKKVGSNIAAHWAESDSAEAKEAMTAGSYSTKDIQNKQNQGISPGGN